MSDEWDEDTTASELHELQEQLVSPRNRPCLTVLTGGAAGQQFKLATGASTIGRAPNNAIRLEDDGISRMHARVITEQPKAWVEDLQSRNGTFVNGDRITGRIELHDGDKLQLGRSTVMRFGFQDALDESFHENLVSSALRDGLTRLFNKRYLMDRLDSELKFARRHETAVSLLMLDLDHFKKVNDTYGHLTGDAVLTHVASLLLRAVRIEDVVARFGGEEMAVVLRATSIEAASHTGERLRRTIEAAPVAFQGQTVRVTVSIGVASYPTTDASTPEALVEAADQALYRAKRAGRNRLSR